MHQQFPQTKFAKVVFLHVSVILPTGVVSQHSLQVVSQHALQQGGFSRGGGKLRGLARGVSRPTPGGVSRPTTGGVSRPIPRVVSRPILGGGKLQSHT